MAYNPSEFENKWIQFWLENQTYKTPVLDEYPAKKFYSLYSFPYPSGDGLHVGHVEGLVANDIMARYYRMRGYASTLPMGWDAFGLPAENFAIKTGTPPKVTTDNSIKNFTNQINQVGIGVDWEKEQGTHWPSYYKWTQWFFLELYKHGLAYRKNAPVNWCPKDQTVLANEQVEKRTKKLEDGTEIEIGVCERCDTEVVQKDMEQWFFKITSFAERLHWDLDRVDWPEGTKHQQRNWIGRSEGTRVEFGLTDSFEKLEIFTTRIDTIFGCTFMVIAPEHKIIETLKEQIKNFDEVQKYILQTKNKTDLERQTQKVKTGIKIEGLRAINPFNHQEVPIFVADYVLAGYGTGAIMAVPAHDERDGEFAKKYSINIVEVIKPSNDEKSDKEFYTEYGVLINSGEYTGKTSEDATRLMQEWLEKNNLGKREIGYKIRDWLVSRQRYWGAPIPMVYSPKAKELGYGYLPKRKLNVLILHGFESSNLEGWKPSIKKQLEELGYNVFVPNLPGGKDPKYADWEKFIEENYSDLLKKPEDLVVIGHSLGGYMAFKLAQKYKFAKVIGVAPSFAQSQNDFTTDVQEKMPGVINSLLTFYKDGGEIEFSSIDSETERVVIYSDNEYLIPENIKNLYKDGIGTGEKALYRVLPGFGHFSGELDGIIDFEELTYFVNIAWNSDMIGILPLLTKNLPVELADDVDFKPTGESPLVYSQVFHKGVKCPIFDTDARREVDTMDTFVDSSWYYLRYCEPKNTKKAFEVPTRLPLANENEKNQKIAEHLTIILREFNDNKINYALFGSTAVAVLNRGFHKEVDDIDLFCTIEDYQKAKDVLAKIGYKFVSEEENKYKWEEELNSSGKDLIAKFEGVDGIEVELMCFEWNSSVLEQRVKTVFNSQTAFISPLNSLVKHYESRGNKEVVEFINSQNTAVNKLLPTDIYIIGTEHTVLHLLYSRFFTKFLFDLGMVNFDEPFFKMRHMGLILGSDSRKMSKRWGNVINPTDEVKQYGGDTLRMYEMFMGPFEDAKPWNNRAENGVFRFLSKVWDLSEKVINEKTQNYTRANVLINKLIKKISEDIENLSFNTSVAKFMEFVNEVSAFEKIEKEIWEKFLKVLAPFAPFITEELWHRLGNSDSIHLSSWPDIDVSALIDDQITIGVQVNGKVRGSITISPSAKQDEAVAKAMEVQLIAKYVTSDPKKVIYVAGKILNIIV